MPERVLHPDADFTLGASSATTDNEAAKADAARTRSRGLTAAVLAALALAGGAIAIYLFWPRQAPVPHPAVPTTPPPIAVAPAPTEPAIAHPVEQIPLPPAADNAQPAAPLPALDDSDSMARDTIEAIINSETLARLLVPGALIRHIVATIDALPRKTLAVGIRPVVPARGVFATTNATDGSLIAGSNGDRYGSYVRAAEAIDTERLVQFYVRLYPLFQQAYVELGYPNGYFNDRLIGVIDHLLAAPEPRPPLRLTQPKVLYQFADPALEDLSAGQKILVRVGIDDQMRLKAKLREIRRALTAKAAKP